MNEEEKQTYERLLDKASEAFVLSIELCNRPSIKYRVEGFSFFICNAWELMLKAKLIKDKGIDSVYYKDNKDRTITLERCISAVFTNSKDPLRRNLEDIIRLRNTSTHFIVEEYEQIYVGLFQSCVTNFDEKMFEFHRRRMADVVPPHFLTLSMSASPANPEVIRAKYPPAIAEKFLFDEAEIEQEQALLENQRYSCVMVTQLAVVKNPKNADFSVSISNDADKSIRMAKIFQDPKSTHPLSVGKIIDNVNKRLSKAGVTLMACGKPKEFTTNDWKLFLNFYDIKNVKEYAYKHELASTCSYSYSMKVVDFICERIADNPSGVIDALKMEFKKKSNEATPGAKDSQR